MANEDIRDKVKKEMRKEWPDMDKNILEFASEFGQSLYEEGEEDELEEEESGEEEK